MAKDMIRHQKIDYSVDPTNNTFAQPKVMSIEERSVLLGFRPSTVWLTGLSGAGKTTIATHVESALLHAGIPVVVIDGDSLRQSLCTDLGFETADRRENVRRAASIARLVNESGFTAIVALISPSELDRRLARTIINPHYFLEVYLSAPLAVCAERDPKGLYSRALAGKINDFTGVSAPYDVPDKPELELNTGEYTIDKCTQAVCNLVVKYCSV